MSEQQGFPGHAEPQARRPHIPGYGVPEGDEGLLPWSHVVERLEQARNYWIGTVGEDGQPHAVPVWGVWVDGALYFGGGPRTSRNLQANPKVVVHLESGDDVVILEGTAKEFADPEPSLFAHFADTYAAKYNFRPEEANGYVLQPRVVYAWTTFPQDATRWRLDNG